MIIRHRGQTGKCNLTESEEMGRMGTYAEATEAVGMGISDIAMAIGKEGCI
jgi:hypothetical protein